MKKCMYRIIYILFKHVKFQYNNLVRYNSQYSVCVAISQGLNNFVLDLLFISLFNKNLIQYFYLRRFLFRWCMTKKFWPQGSYAWVFIVTSLQVSAFRSVGMFSRQCSLTWAGMIQQNYKRTDKVHVYRADKKQFTHKWFKKLTSHQFLNDAKNNIIPKIIV